MSGPTGIVLNSGVGGATLGVDADASFNYQIVKIGYSVAGTTPVQVSTTNPLPVVLQNAGATQPVSGTFWQATQPVSGTVTANQGGAPWTQNTTQFGGTNLSTGIGTGGAGIPRVTVSSDSFPATQAVTQSGAWGVSINGQPVSVSQSGAWSTSVNNFPTLQPITHSGVPQPVYLADSEHVFDDDGVMQVSLKPDSDVAGVLNTIATVGHPVSGTVNVANFPAMQPVSGALAISASALPAGAALESAGQLQRVADLLEALLIETRATNVILSTLHQPMPEDADRIRGDLSLSLN